MSTRLRLAGRRQSRITRATAVLALGLFLAWPATAATTGDLPKPSDSQIGNYLAGRHAQSERKVSAAADYFKAALAKDPNNPDLLASVFTLLAIDGRIEEAGQYARQLVGIDAQANPLADLLIAVIEAKDGRFHDADARLSRVPDVGVLAFLLPLVKSWILVAEGDVDKALSMLDTATDNEGAAILNNTQAGLINEFVGRDKTAERLYADAAKRRSQPNLRLTQIAGALYARAGEPDKARALYDAYLADRPDSTMLEGALADLEAGKAPPPPVGEPIDGVAEALFAISGAIRQQDSVETMLFARLAVYARPDFPIAQMLIAEILESEQRYEEADAIYRTIPKSSDFSWSARLRLANNLDILDQPDEAVALLRDMERERKTRYDALVAMGDIERRRERYREAARAYEEAKQRIPEIEERHWTLLYASGIAYERIKQWPKAEADFLKALELSPDQPFVLNYLGYSWVEMGKNLTEARAMIEKAVSKRPRDGYIVDSLGWVAYQLGDLPEAIEQMERAVELRPEDPTINDHLGDVYWRVGRKLEARFQWDRALTLDPEPELAAKIKNKLAGETPEPPPAKRAK